MDIDKLQAAVTAILKATGADSISIRNGKLVADHHTHQWVADQIYNTPVADDEDAVEALKAL
jgi:hypothetical protein